MIKIFLPYPEGGINTQNLMNRWSPAYRDQLMSQYDTDKEELVTFFGKTRDDLIAEDLKAWVGLNKVLLLIFVSITICRIT